MVYAPCSSVRCSPINSRLQRVAPQNGVKVAVELLKIMGRRKERLGRGKRPAPIETDTVVGAGTAQHKYIIHADRVGAARRDRQSAGVVIHELMNAAIAIGGNALDQVVGANLGGSIRLRVSIDDHMSLARAGDGDSSRQLRALVGGDGECHSFSDLLMISSAGRRGR